MALTDYIPGVNDVLDVAGGNKPIQVEITPSSVREVAIPLAIVLFVTIVISLITSNAIIQMISKK
ncbi:MAG: hypothetical protein ABL951_04215 [Alphaproteobacteria bacterium]